MTDTTRATTKLKTQAQTYDNWIGREAVDPQGSKIGEIKDVLYDDVTCRPEWVVVKTGLLGGRSIAPIAGASIRQTGIKATGLTSTSGTDPVVDLDPDDVQLVLAYSKDRIKHAPDVDPSDENRDDDPEHDSPEGHLSPAEERELYAHYGFRHEGRTPNESYGVNFDTVARPDRGYRGRRWNARENRWDDADANDNDNMVAGEMTEETTVRLRRYELH